MHFCQFVTALALSLFHSLNIGSALLVHKVRIKGAVIHCNSFPKYINKFLTVHSLALILGHVIANLLLNRGEALNRKSCRSNRARCAQSSIENSFRRRGRGRATPSSSSRGDSLIDRCYPQWWRFTLTSPRLEYAWRCLQHIICFFLE